MFHEHALVIFAEVVKQGSFAQAARQLNCPTTTVSRKISQLEKQLGGRLLTRSTRALAMTELGIQILPKARLILPKARLIVETLHEVNQVSSQLIDQPQGLLTISAPRALTTQVLIEFLSKFQKQYPDIHLNIHHSEDYQHLITQEIDFAFRVGPVADSDAIALPLANLDYCLLAAPSLVEQAQPILTMEDLLALPRISDFSGQDNKVWQHYGLSSSMSPPQASCTASDLQSLQSLAIKGHGVVSLPGYLVEQAIVNEQLIELFPNRPRPKRPLFLVYPDKKLLPQKSQLLLEFFRHQRNELSARL